MFDKLSYLGRDLLMETIPLLVEGKLTPIKQDESKVTFAYNVTPEEEALDFTKDARQVFNHIRAYDPEPGAYFKLGDIIIKVYKSRISGKTHDVACGDIVDAGKDYFSVACGNHTVLDILTVQPSGKRIMSAQDFNNGLLRNLMKKRG
jgi:methionyl-tRNA formyltransferase